MDGKIFADSANVWQDQAKILFTYYRQAAERIVSEEERIEGQIAQLEKEKAALEEKLSKAWVYLFLLIFPYFIVKSNLEKQIAGIDERINEFRKVHGEIFRDYKVNKLGVAYVPVAEQVKYQNKSFIVDFTHSVPESDISLSLSRQNQLLIETIHALDHLAKEAPLVETSEESETVATDEYSLSIQEIKENDYLGALERSLRTVAFCMDDLETASVSLPLVLDDSPYLPKLDQFATASLPENAPVVEIFDNTVYAPGVERFREINELKSSLSNETSQFEEILKGLMTAIGTSVQTIARMKVASVDKVVLESNRLLYQILKAPYNHYSPALEAEEIERIRHEEFDYAENIQEYEPFQLRQSSRVKFNPMSGTWVAEDGSQTIQPFGIHQMYEEIVAPMVQNLMQENRIERLKIYNHIKDQKISYLNKWHQDTDAFYRSNRAESADLINLMQATLTEYVSAFNNLLALQRTEQQMENSEGNLDSTVVDTVDNTDDSIAAFELQSQEFQKCQNDFEDYIERLKEDIDLKAAKFGHVEYFDAKLRDGYSNSVAVAAAEIHEMDDRRKTLATVNPKLAKDSELPPQPHVSDLTNEHFSLNLPAMVREALESLNGPIETYVPDAELQGESKTEIQPEPDFQPVNDFQPEFQGEPEFIPMPQDEAGIRPEETPQEGPKPETPTEDTPIEKKDDEVPPVAEN
ncbi:MAG: hypothetical protein K2K82_03715 [Muribaculaceae bacterium]|nr:hypothetical protein [Muribaculaceae bacterium]